MNVEDLTAEQMVQVIKRDRFIKEQLSARIAALTSENVELLAIIQEQHAMLQPVPVNGDGEGGQ
jgi:hypothetical protein